MQWKQLLKEQQLDFIERLKFEPQQLLKCGLEGRHSELTVIAEGRLTKVREFSWTMTEKFRKKHNSTIRNIFDNNYKGKLGEEVVAVRLKNFVAGVDYEYKVRGDGKVDFTLRNNPTIGIQVKTYSGSTASATWTITKEESEKNDLVICILIPFKFDITRKSYSLISAGFILTDDIDFLYNRTTSSIKLDELLYFGGLYGYLRTLEKRQVEKSITNRYLEIKKTIIGLNNLSHEKILLAEQTIIFIFVNRPELRSYILEEIQEKDLEFSTSEVRSIYRKILELGFEFERNELLIRLDKLPADLLSELRSSASQPLESYTSCPGFLFEPYSEFHESLQRLFTEKLLMEIKSLVSILEEIFCERRANHFLTLLQKIDDSDVGSELASFYCKKIEAENNRIARLREAQTRLNS